MKRENLFFGNFGNGLFVSDKNVIKDGDYKSLAHISLNGTIKYYCDVSDEAKKEIEEMAKNSYKDILYYSKGQPKTARASFFLQLMDKDYSYSEAMKKTLSTFNVSKSQIESELKPWF